MKLRTGFDILSIALKYADRKEIWSSPTSKIEKIPRGIQGEKSNKDTVSSRNLVSTIGAQASPKLGDGTRCPKG